MTGSEHLGRVHFGDAFSLVEKMPAGFVDCTVTSVPYWQQREYLPAGHPLKAFEMGGEATIAKYLADMASLFAQVLRVTKPSGVLWLNVGDKYVTGPMKRLCPGYHEGELLGLPHLLSEAVRSAGWRRVAEVIWWKTNGNPEATARRPTCAHEPMYLFAKGPAHFFDPVAIQEPAAYPDRPRRSGPDPDDGRELGEARLMRRARSVWPIPTVNLDGRKLLSDLKEDGRYLVVDPECGVHGESPTVSPGGLFDASYAATGEPACSCRAVEDDFFAAMPPRLAERAILATTPEVGCCRECGAPMKRIVKKERVATRSGAGAKVDAAGKSRRDPGRHVTFTETVGWSSTCGHTPRSPVPAVVFDPFCGSGTSPMVAAALGRSWLACELSPINVRLAKKRIAAGWDRSPLP